MIEFIVGAAIGLVIGIVIGRYEPAPPESESTVSPVSLDYWKVPSAQADLPPPQPPPEYRPPPNPVDELFGESKRAELVRKLAERAER